MFEYIDLEAVLKDFKERYCSPCKGAGKDHNGCKCDVCWVENLPSADVAPVVHGRWVKHYRSGTTVAEGYVSTCCDMWNNRKSDYCPNCGARMDGDGCH